MNSIEIGGEIDSRKAVANYFQISQNWAAIVARSTFSANRVKRCGLLNPIALLNERVGLSDLIAIATVLEGVAH